MKTFAKFLKRLLQCILIFFFGINIAKVRTDKLAPASRLPSHTSIMPISSDRPRRALSDKALLQKSVFSDLSNKAAARMKKNGTLDKSTEQKPEQEEEEQEEVVLSSAEKPRRRRRAKKIVAVDSDEEEDDDNKEEEESDECGEPRSDESESATETDSEVELVASSDEDDDEPLLEKVHRNFEKMSPAQLLKLVKQQSQALSAGKCFCVVCILCVC